MTQRSYKATGINLKAMPMGESDRLVTVLTKENGLVRASAPGARKHKSKLAGRSGLFVVNDLLFIKGKSIDKLVQAETQRSFPGLSKDLAKLTASQYLAEIVLSQALTGQPQEELYYLLIEHLSRLESASRSTILPCLAQATFHLLALAGVAPEVFRCCLSRSLLTPTLGNPDWRAGFSVSSGGAIDMAEIERIAGDRLEAKRAFARKDSLNATQKNGDTGGFKARVTKELAAELGIVGYLSAAELALMQQLSKPKLVMTGASDGSQSNPRSGTQSGTIMTEADASLAESGPHLMWQHIEKFLRQYTQYQFDRPIRSAALIDICFTPLTHAS
ncbi:MAG: DNA repair protein RecO [Phormidesmis sp.]